MSRVYLLAYVRQRGEVCFAGMGPLSSSRPVGAAAKVSDVLAAWSLDVWSARVAAFLRPRRPGFDAGRISTQHAERMRLAVCRGDAAEVREVFAELLEDVPAAARAAGAFEAFLRHTVQIRLALGRADGPDAPRSTEPRATSGGDDAAPDAPRPSVPQDASPGVGHDPYRTPEEWAAYLEADPDGWEQGLLDGLGLSPIGAQPATPVTVEREASPPEPPSEAAASSARALGAPPRASRLNRRPRQP